MHLHVEGTNSKKTKKQTNNNKKTQTSKPCSCQWTPGCSSWGSGSQCWAEPWGMLRSGSPQNRPPPLCWPSPPLAVRLPLAGGRRRTLVPTADRCKQHHHYHLETSDEEFYSDFSSQLKYHCLVLAPPFLFFFYVPQLSLGFITVGEIFCVFDCFSIQPLR